MNSAARHLKGIIDRVSSPINAELLFIAEVHALANYAYGHGKLPNLICSDESDYEEQFLEVEWVDLADIPF